MSSSLSEFREIVRLLFRVVDPAKTQSADLSLLLDRIHDLLQAQAQIPDRGRFIDAFVADSIIERPPTPPTLVIHPDIGGAVTAEEIIPNVIVTKSEPEEKTVTVSAPSTASKPAPQNIVVTRPIPTAAAPAKTLDSAIFKSLKQDEDSDDDSDDSDSVRSPDIEDEEDSDMEPSDDEELSEEEPSDDEEEEEEPDDVEEEEEDDEAYDEDRDGEMSILKIKKERYWLTSKNNKVFEYQDGAYGDCIGTYKDGKIVSPN
jgi:hypothetical protein